MNSQTGFKCNPTSCDRKNFDWLDINLLNNAEIESSKNHIYLQLDESEIGIYLLSIAFKQKHFILRAFQIGFAAMILAGSSIGGCENVASAQTNNLPSQNTEISQSQIPETVFPNTDKPIPIGIFFGSKEVGNLDIIRQNNVLLIPLEEFSKLADIKIDKLGNQIKLKTPIGLVELTPKDIQDIQGIEYISAPILEQKIYTKIEFNQLDFAISIDLPWRTGRKVPIVQETLKPEFSPPSNSISTLRQQLDSNTRIGGSTDLRSSSLLTGRFLDNAWRLRLDTNFNNTTELSEYFLYNRSGNFGYQIGKQDISLHPLLNSISLTGVQLGFTNLPPERFFEANQATELLPRRAFPIQTFRGFVPPTSIVLLRVGGAVIRQQQVGLSGYYEFPDVNLSSSSLNEVELLIFDRRNLNTPSEIRKFNFNTSDLLLPVNGSIQLVGAGAIGNLANGALGLNNNSDNNRGKFTGFYQVRQGISDGLTLEGAVQYLPQNNGDRYIYQGQVGAIARVLDPLVVSASIGQSSLGKTAYSTDFNLNLNAIRVQGSADYFPANYNTVNETRDRFNRGVDLSYRVGSDLDIGANYRERQDSSTFVSYILPSFNWRPTNNVSIFGRPGSNAEYLYNIYYQPSTPTRISFAGSPQNNIVDLSYTFDPSLQGSFSYSFGDNNSPLYSFLLTSGGQQPGDISWGIGAALSNGEIRPQANASLEITPGLLGRIDYRGFPARNFGSNTGTSGDQVSISLVTDLAFNQGGVVPANSSSFSRGRGNIAGKIKILNSDNLPSFNLSGASVSVKQGDRAFGSSVLDSQGNFFVGNIPDGVYVVELEPNELPVELSILKSSRVARVAGGATTDVEFAMQAEFGVAGRIRDAKGQTKSNISLQLVNTQGVVVKSTRTDEFGLYRIDGIPIGKYKIQVILPPTSNIGKQSPSLDLEIRDRFLFDRDLQILSETDLTPTQNPTTPSSTSSSPSFTSPSQQSSPLPTKPSNTSPSVSIDRQVNF